MYYLITAAITPETVHWNVAVVYGPLKTEGETPVAQVSLPRLLFGVAVAVRGESGLRWEIANVEISGLGSFRGDAEVYKTIGLR